MTDTLMIHLITTNYFSVNKTKQIDGSEEMGDESKKGGKKLGLLWASKRASVHSFWKGDGGDGTTPNRIEMFQHRIKMISLKNVVLICILSGAKSCQQKKKERKKNPSEQSLWFIL